MIDYRKIADSVDYYESLGFQRIEAPWWVSKEIMDVTAPADAGALYYLETNKKCLVASGEQSFLYLATKGRLPAGKYQTVTPCFRDESIGVLRKKAFIKNELIITDKVNQQSLDDIISQAYLFFKKYAPHKALVDVVTTESGFDINYAGIEVGSYGIRRWDFMEWVYATGCAEPRLTRAIRIAQNRERYEQEKTKSIGTS